MVAITTRSGGRPPQPGSGVEGAAASVEKAPRVTVDLNLPPRMRWKPAARQLAPQLAALAEELSEAARDIGTRRMKQLTSLWEAALTRCGMQDLIEELHGMAECLGLPPRILILGQMQYELAVAGCTSFILRAPAAPLLCRTLDWDAALSPLVAEVAFTRGTEVIAIAPSMVGLLGCTTGAAVGRAPSRRFSIALNHRPEVEDTAMHCDEDVIHALDRRWSFVVAHLRTCFPVATLIRKVLLSGMTYPEAVGYIAEQRLAASAYVLVAGTRDGVCLTKGRDVAGSAEAPLPPVPWGCVVQCNHDGEGIPGSRMRDAGSVEREGLTQDFLMSLPGLGGQLMQECAARGWSGATRAVAGRLQKKKKKGKAKASRAVLHALVQALFRHPPVFCKEMTAFYSVSDPASNRHACRTYVGSE